MKKGKKAGPRLNIRIPLDLLVWVKDYAHRNNTTVTEVFITYLRALRDHDTEVPQI